MKFVANHPKFRLKLLLIFIGMACLMSVFETVKQVLYPDITVWESHFVTILFSSTMATVTAAVLIAHFRMAMLIYEINDDAILITDETNRIINVNPAFTRVTGYSLEEVKGQNPKMLQSGEQSPDFYRKMWGELKENSFWEGEIWNRRKDGQKYAQRVQIHALRYPNGMIFRHVAQFSDITEKKLLDEAVWKAANFDELTKLPNRTLFHDRLNQALRNARRGHYGLAVLFIDLDYFKQINDEFGHVKGDVLLVEIAGRLASCLRDTDTVARIGGDEFAVILQEIHNRDSAMQIAKKLRAAVDAPVDLGDGQVGYVSASIGLCCFPQDANTAEELIDFSDKAMYQVKAQGRNGVSMYMDSPGNRSEEFRNVA